ncbi:MAG: hypothetical protein ACE5I5_10405 [Candidatus Heimdallarchaeota archaeon]
MNLPIGLFLRSRFEIEVQVPPHTHAGRRATYARLASRSGLYGIDGEPAPPVPDKADWTPPRGCHVPVGIGISPQSGSGSQR